MLTFLSDLSCSAMKSMAGRPTGYKRSTQIRAVQHLAFTTSVYQPHKQCFGSRSAWIPIDFDRKKGRNFKFWSMVLDVLFWGLKASPIAWTSYGGLRISKLQYLIIKPLDLDRNPHWPKMLDPDPYPDHHWLLKNQHWLQGFGSALI